MSLFNKKNPIPWTEADDAEATSQPSGLKIRELVVGEGAECTPGSKATMHYTGWLMDGKKFDSSHLRGDPFVTAIPGPLIKGWNEGIPGMKVGGKRKLFIPAALGYGARGAGGSIPPNSDLVFEVELLKVG